MQDFGEDAVTVNVHGVSRAFLDVGKRRADFAKENDSFEVKALAVSGQMLGAEQLDVLAKLPTRDQALSMLMSVMQAPATKLVQTMNEVPGKLVRTLAAVRDQKEAAA